MTSLIAHLVSVIVQTKPRIRKNKHGIPLPKVCHKEMEQGEVGERCVFVIGDVHGCLDEMLELIENAQQIHKDTLFLFVGDLVNKGPKSVEVVKELRAMGDSAYAVRGNHDEGALREIRSYKEDDNYTLPDRYEWIKRLDDDDIEFLQELPYTISIPFLNTLIVHAGVIPGKPLELQDLNALTNMRNIVDEGDPFWTKGLVARNKTDAGQSWVTFWSGPQHVYFGHDAMRLLQMSEFATGLDTGCCYGGAMTGVFVNGCRQLLTVKSRQEFSFDND